MVAGDGPQGALGGPVVTNGRLERLAGPALAGRALAGADLRCSRGTPRSALHTAASASRSLSLIWSRFALICTSSRWRSEPENPAVAFVVGSVLPGVVSDARFHSFSFVSGARTSCRRDRDRRRCVRGNCTRSRRA